MKGNRCRNISRNILSITPVPRRLRRAWLRAVSADDRRPYGPLRGPFPEPRRFVGDGGKGNRSQAVTDACKKHGGFYLGSIGGPAAVLAKDSIKSVEVVDFPELGMEAVRKIYVENFPAFLLVDDKGNDFFAAFKK